MGGDMFNKKFLLYGAIAVLALLGVLLLLTAPIRPSASDNRHFGLVKDVYTLTPEEWTTVEVEGDTDAFPSAEVNLSVVTGWYTPDIYDFDTRTYVPSSGVRVTVRFETTLRQKIVRTSQHYENGEPVGEPVGEPEGRDGCVGGYVEKRVDGEWVEVAQLDGSVGPITPRYASYSHDFFADASGEYRFTYYFRKYFSESYGTYVPAAYDPDDFSTGEELYTVSHTVTIPEPKDIEPTDRRFDLLSFTLLHSSDESSFELVLRPNGVDAPYLQSTRARLQWLDGEKWVDVKDAPYGNSAVYISVENHTATVLTADGESVNCCCLGGRLYTPESGRYRLVLGFSEMELNRGDKYPLTIYFELP